MYKFQLHKEVSPFPCICFLQTDAGIIFVCIKWKFDHHHIEETQDARNLHAERTSWNQFINQSLLYRGSLVGGGGKFQDS